MTQAPPSAFIAALLEVVPRSCLLLPADLGYDTARLVYNRMHDRHPLAIVRSLDPAVLRASVAAAHDRGIDIAVRGGGHHIGGFSTIEGGLLVDFSEFRSVEFDRGTQIASVQPGARLVDLDECLAAFGRCVPAGTVSDTGVTGLTLGGGIGWLVCSSGLACDYLQSLTVLTSDGRLLEVSSTENADLFFALRGGGVGAFGLILNLRFVTRELPQIVAGSVCVDIEDSDRVLETLQQLHLESPLIATSLAPTLTREGGRSLLSVDLCCLLSGASELERIRAAIGGDWSDMVERPYIEWQKHFDEQFDPPRRGYWKSVHFDSLTLDPAIVRSAVLDAPSDGCSVLIEFYNPATLGAFSDGSAYPLRRSWVGVLLAARWDDEEDDVTHVAWARTWARALRLNGGGKSYSNYSSTDEIGLQPTFAAGTLRAFAELERMYDPAGIYRRGHRSALSGEVVSS